MSKDQTVSEKIRVALGGMSCQACATRIEKVLNRQAAVTAANVNFAGEEAQIEYDASRIQVPELLALIEKIGFQAAIKTEETNDTENPAMPWRLLGLLLAALLFVPGMLGMLFGDMRWMLPVPWQFALATVVQLGLAGPFYRSAWASLRGGLANMDVLVVLGSLSIWLYSSAMWWFSGSHDAAHTHVPVYFEASVMVIALVSLGKYWEGRTKKSSLNSMGLLLRLTPNEVECQRNGQWQRLALAEVVAGDIIRAKQGERIAADGHVLSGQAWLDESHLTGESEPVFKQTGDRLLAGALVSDGSVVFAAEALGSATVLGDMMRALSEAQGSKAPIARLADQVAAVFVPVVVVIALLTFGLTYAFSGSLNAALMHAVAVLVIACPCALGLATPAAIMAGMGLAARHGIWFKDAAALERAGKVDVVVLDKTGTLTTGRPALTAVWLADEHKVDHDTLLRLLAAVESQVSHPLARAIVAAAHERGLDIATAEQIQVTAGAGVSGRLAPWGELRVGQPIYCGFRLPESVAEQAVWRTASVVGLSINGEACGAVALADTLKPDSIAAVQAMQQQGLQLYIMSGDKAEVVAHIAGQLGIAHAQGGMSPRDKAQAVQDLTVAGKTVAMVGDGVNDAPALAAAAVSFAMKDGTDVAEHTAHATLMRHSVAQVGQALWIARATVTNIRQNLFFAFFYNCLGIPLAAFGWLNPVLAAAAMALSSVSVISNALRLKRVKVPL